MKKKGYIIVIDGTDGCGKQTQSKLLASRLESAGYPVKLQSFPNYDSPSSGPVKMYLGGDFGNAQAMDAYQASALFAVDRLCTMFSGEIKSFYENGGILILDRYTQANMIHQAGKLHSTVEVDALLDWIDDFEFNTLKLPKADRVIFLDVPVDVSLRLMEERGAYKAGTKKDVHEEDPNHLRHAYNAGKYVGKKFGWDMIDCTENGKLKSREEISDIIWDRVKSDLENIQDREM